VLLFLNLIQLCFQNKLTKSFHCNLKKIDLLDHDKVSKLLIEDFRSFQIVFIPKSWKEFALNVITRSFCYKTIVITLFK
jgi:hypothetical protein